MGCALTRARSGISALQQDPERLLAIEETGTLTNMARLYGGTSLCERSRARSFTADGK